MVIKMSYLLDKSRKRNRFIKIAIGVILLVVLFYFRVGIFGALSYMGQLILRPVLVVGNSASEKFKSFGGYFAFKNSLYRENLDLKSKLDADRADRANYDSTVSENVLLKEMLGRKSENANRILATILAKPNQSPYDTLLIDVGTELGVKIGDRVFASATVPIGRVAEVYPRSSKVVLFSNSGEQTEVILKETFLEITGRGGGNFEMAIPRDVNLTKGDEAVLPGITPYVVAIVETTLSDPRDSFIKALLVAPVNIQGLKFVEVAL